MHAAWRPKLTRPIVRVVGGDALQGVMNESQTACVSSEAVDIAVVAFTVAFIFLWHNTCCRRTHDIIDEVSAGV